MKQSQQTLNTFNSINLVIVIKILNRLLSEDSNFYQLSHQLFSIRLKSSMEKKEQEQSCWVLSDSPQCNIRQRADNRKEYALSVSLEFDASIAICTPLVSTDGDITVPITTIKQEWEAIWLENKHAKILTNLWEASLAKQITWLTSYFTSTTMKVICQHQQQYLSLHFTLT